MVKNNQHGISLVEVMIVIMTMAVLATGAVAFVSTCLDAHTYNSEESDLYREGFLLMERMTSRARACTYLFIPNNNKSSWNMLLMSDMKNDDSDFYFNDPLFPRTDEDPDAETLGWGWGIIGLDDNGDGSVDNAASKADDDEDGLTDEDFLNGIDDDGDGNVDEDLGKDITADGSPGIENMDDDGDGIVDEPDMGDDNDDEDNLVDEDAITTVLYSYDSGSNTLKEIYPDTFDGINAPIASHVISTRVTEFKTQQQAPNLIKIILELTGKHGLVVGFSEHVHIRNVYQRTGKRVK